MKRAIAILFLAAAAVPLAGCMTTEESWRRIDGTPLNGQQLLADQTVCRGEMQKSNLSSTMERGVVIRADGLHSPRRDAMADVYRGCMAQRGYLSAPK